MSKNRHQRFVSEAAKQNGNALQYVKEQTPEMCLKLLNRMEWLLEYVEEQTPEMCLKLLNRMEMLYNMSKNKHQRCVSSY